MASAYKEKNMKKTGKTGINPFEANGSVSLEWNGSKRIKDKSREQELKKDVGGSDSRWWTDAEHGKWKEGRQNDI